MQLAQAIELALAVASGAVDDIEGLLASWRGLIGERRGSAIHRLPALLVRQPVVDAGYVASHLGVSDRMARNVLERACEYGFLRQLGSARRNRFFQCDALLAVLEEASSEEGIRRTLRGC